MRMVFGLVLVVGLALAGFAVFMAQSYIGTTQAALERERAARVKMGPTVEVFVVNKPVEFGHVLTPEDVQKIYWPKSALPETAFTDQALLFPGDGSKQRTIVRSMEKFEPLLATKVTEPGEDAGLTTRLARGMRAFAIKVDVSSGVSGFVRPGDRIDVYWTGSTQGLSIDGMATGEMTKLIESGVTVAAVDQTSNADRAASNTIARTVTVEATPQQVARLAQAQATGRLALSLVGTGDETEAAATDVDKRGLLGIAEATPEVIVEKKVCSIKKRSGVEVVEIPIPCTN
ncbi:MAG: Flp pilus assembly protein CpaB [Gemmobacter sp.]|nr:Flp pilus assembly protein CpaB [Gemmobacter sp.]